MTQLAATAPASRAEARIVSISASVSPGTTGDTITRTSIPAAASRSMARSRRASAGTRGFIVRASAASSVVKLIPTRASPAAAISDRMSMSHSTIAPLVAIERDWRNRCSTSRIPRMIRQSRSIGW